MTDRKEFYETLLKDFLKELWILADLTEEDFKKLPKYDDYTFRNLYHDIETWSESGPPPKDESWEEFRLEMLEKCKKKAETEYDIFAEQLYQKHYTTPGGLCGELAQMVAQAREVLPHKFKVALRGLDFYESHGTETVFVMVVFIKEDLLN